VDGLPAVYETWVRPDAVHTSLVVGVAWMDTKLMTPALYSGSTIPGGGPFKHTAPVSGPAARTLVAAFNSGFLMSNANGDYYTDGRTIRPLRNGAASFVIYRNGTPGILAWSHGATVPPDVVAVRQNLDLLVEGGKPIPGLNPSDTTQWGFTLGNAVYVWRSGLGITAGGALVYVGGPGLNITTLARILARAGAVRAMELDINTDWVDFATYHPHSPSGVADPANGTNRPPWSPRQRLPGGLCSEPWPRRSSRWPLPRGTARDDRQPGSRPSRHTPARNRPVLARNRGYRAGRGHRAAGLAHRLRDHRRRGAGPGGSRNRSRRGTTALLAGGNRRCRPGHRDGIDPRHGAVGAARRDCGGSAGPVAEGSHFRRAWLPPTSR